MSYIPIVVLPNLALRNSIDTEFVSLVPASDPRILAVVAEEPNFGEFISRFRSVFGQKVEPATILRRSDAPATYCSAEATAGFRDAVAFSAVGYAKAMQIDSGNNWVLGWSNYFSIYPWMIAKTGKLVVAFTPAIAGMDSLEKFGGQSSPEIFINSYDDRNFDQPLRTALLARWHQAFSAEIPERRNVALFRALNMALAASAIPSGQEITYYDVGRHIALWISAFEILAHPGPGGSSGINAVYRLLESAHWTDPKSSAQVYPAYHRHPPSENKINACWLYGELYRQRNNFLHGNPVTAGNLRLPSGRRLIDLAAPLFRMALTAYLPLTLEDAAPPDSDISAYAAYLMKYMRFYGPQHTIEDALLKAQTASEVD